MSLVLVMVVASLGAAFLQMSATGARVQTHSVDQMQAFYAAEAGLAEAFLAVRMGRTGRIGSEEDPASFGESTLWVETMETDDGRLWLRSSSRNGLARATLGLVVDPPDPPLGFFAEEDIVIDSVLLVDGFDSSERTYEEEVGASKTDGDQDEPRSRWERPSEDEGAPPIVVEPESPHADAQRAAIEYDEVFGRSHLRHFLENQVQVVDRPTCVVSMHPIDPHDFLAPAELEAFIDDLLPMLDAHSEGRLFPSQYEPGSREWKRERKSWKKQRKRRGRRSRGSWTRLADAIHERLWIHTNKGGVLGSNGNIVFKNSKKEPVAVHGSVVPGVKGRVKGASDEEVTGSTEARATEAELERVAVPDVDLHDVVVHESVIPMVIPPGTVGFDSLTVGPSSELILRGPARIVVGDLDVSADGKLSLDTRDGNVELYVVGSLDMETQSIVETTAQRSTEVTIKAARRSRRAEAPRLDLDATGDFHGTVYAPESTVHIGSDFEVFGSVAARRLEIGSGARLHFDDENYDGMLAVPKQESWRILDLPNKAQDPAPRMANGLRPLAAAHDLESVKVSVQYVDRRGVVGTYSGPESGFDWSNVSSIGNVERSDETPEDRRTKNEWTDWWGAWDNEDVADFLKGLGAAWGRDAGDGYSETKKKDDKKKRKRKKKRKKKKRDDDDD